VYALGVDPVMATGWHMVIGGAPLLALSLSREPELYTRIVEGGLNGSDAGLLAYSSLLGGAVAYGLFFIAASRGSLVRLSSLTFLTPMFAAATGFAVLGETLTPTQLLGAAITLCGVYFVNAKSSAEKEGTRE
jgi:drug/metabolite transporter (DMT)-like permease